MLKNKENLPKTEKSKESNEIIKNLDEIYEENDDYSDESLNIEYDKIERISERYYNKDIEKEIPTSTNEGIEEYLIKNNDQEIILNGNKFDQRQLLNNSLPNLNKIEEQNRINDSNQFLVPNVNKSLSYPKNSDNVRK